jgi:DNA-binding transcriptional ArsR family regulator
MANIGVFGTATRTSTLLAIHMLGETHASELASLLGRSVSRIRNAVDSLEAAGLVVAVEEGRTRRISLNRRFIAADELTSLLAVLGTHDRILQDRLATKRRRPRRAKKAL